MHSDKEVDAKTGKPQMILDYNATKEAIDKVDQLCHNYSVEKRTKRWPLAYFYNYLNTGKVNVLAVYQSKFPE